MGEITKGILIGSGGIILAAFIMTVLRRLIQKDGPKLIADLVAVPFDAPSDVSTEFTDDLRRKLERLSEPADTEKSQEVRDIRRDIRTTVREYERVIDKIGFELRRIAGAQYVSISNIGNQPIEDVFLASLMPSTTGYLMGRSKRSNPILRATRQLRLVL